MSNLSNLQGSLAVQAQSAAQQQQGANIQGASGSITTGYIGTGGITTTSNQLYGGQINTPYWTTSPSYGYHTPLDPNTFSFRKVENGYILSRQGKEYVVSDEKAVEKFLKLAGVIL